MASTSRALARYLQRQGLTKVAFARRVGVSDSQVVRWVKGERTPSTAVALRIESVTAGQLTVADLVRARRARRRG